MTLVYYIVGAVVGSVATAWSYGREMKRVLAEYNRALSLLEDFETALNEAHDALQDLHDAQNGPPLLTPRHVKFWEEAMRKTKAVLGMEAVSDE